MKKLFLLLLLPFLSEMALAHKISGQVINQNKEPVGFALIQHTRTHNQTVSDSSGWFELYGVNPGDTLEIFHMGFEPLRVPLAEEKFVSLEVNESPIELSEVMISAKTDNLSIISQIDQKNSPVRNSQKILEQIPGLIIGQHAGGGKAEQIFFRGFDIDHGTDLEIRYEGMPVNLVSHAHGQGYTDLHFIIPELIDHIDFSRGPYLAEQGNFATTGTVGITTKTSLDQHLLSVELGDFGHRRALAAFQLANAKKHKAYTAVDAKFWQGPFESPQNLNRFNVFGKYAFQISPENNVSLQLSHFQSEWDASGQIPNREVENGNISRFGAIDDTEGGSTSRSMAIANGQFRLDNKSTLETNAYFAYTEFDLFSNFTFFLQNPEEGDQIRQTEKRKHQGLETIYKRNIRLGKINSLVRFGATLRKDCIGDLNLLRTVNRTEVLERLRDGHVQEYNIGSFADMVLEKNGWVLQPGVRHDWFSFGYRDDIEAQKQFERRTAQVLSPKLQLSFNPNNQIQYFLKLGQGFHSNDSRLITEGDAELRLAKASGGDIGILWKPQANLLLSFSLWQLWSQQELVYVGDEGIVEASDPANRKGVDLSLRFQTNSGLFLNSDINYAHSRSAGGEYIPLAPSLSMSYTLGYKHANGFFSEAGLRFLADRPADEKGELQADGYGILDFSTGYAFKGFKFTCALENVMGVEWNETQFATESRLEEESSPVEEIHFTPGNPRNLRAKLSYRF